MNYSATALEYVKANGQRIEIEPIDAHTIRETVARAKEGDSITLWECSGTIERKAFKIEIWRHTVKAYLFQNVAVSHPRDPALVVQSSDMARYALNGLCDFEMKVDGAKRGTITAVLGNMERA
jgi:hypothetical protein